MNNKFVVSSILLILCLATLTTFYAEDVTVVSSEFTLPEGFSLNETDENMVVLMSDDGERAIVVYEGEVTSIEEARQNRLDMGFRLISEETYDTDGIEINQQNYVAENIISCVYTFNKNDKDYIVTLNIPVEEAIPEDEDNPVSGIVASLH